MMRLLTGADQRDDKNRGGGGGGGGFVFSPRSVDAFGSTVIAEGGADDARHLYWVHAWTVGPDGVITQLREYFNTDLTVTLLSGSGAASSTKKADIAGAPSKQQDAASASSSSTSPSAASSSAAAGPKCLWQSRRADSAQKSLPGLVLAI